MCEYRLAPGVIPHAGTGRVGLNLSLGLTAGSRVLVGDVHAGYLKLEENRTAPCGCYGRGLVVVWIELSQCTEKRRETPI